MKVRFNWITYVLGEPGGKFPFVMFGLSHGFDLGSINGKKDINFFNISYVYVVCIFLALLRHALKLQYYIPCDNSLKGLLAEIA